MSSDQNYILVTGCSGRLGSAILKKFQGSYRTIGLDIKKPEEVEQAEDYFYMDITKPTSVQNVMNHILETYGNQLVSVIHLAAYYSFSQQDWDLYKNITIDGTKNLLKGLKPFEVEQFIFSSTQLVYGPCEVGETINVNSPLQVDWEYPRSKVITEKEVMKLKDDIPVCIMRISGVYDDYCHSIPLSHQIQRIYEDQFQKIFFPGDPSHGAPFMHMDDFIEALFKTVEKRKELSNEQYLLLGEPKTYSYETIQKELGKLLLNKEIKTYAIPKSVAKCGSWIQNHIPFYPEPFIKPWMIDISDDHYELDISQTKESIGWEPQNNLLDTLPKMVEALKKDPDGWYKEHKLK